MAAMTARHETIKPAHPGEHLREDYIPALKRAGVTLSGLARNLRTSRNNLNLILDARRGVSPEMAVKLAAVFPHTTPEFWANMQSNHDLWLARKTVDTSGITAVAVGQQAV
ncbi:MAG: addiction module antidote protein, HigA family [Alphaproteobacteria bacterium]|nr:MAG: addiction module antidote protein, HigA family [Alphaproteobacteria bacterium]